MQQILTEPNQRLTKAKELMQNFLLATGVVGKRPSRRYLWTDALAVENLILLELKTGDQKFTHCALELVDLVHSKLGKFDKKDKRKGWISALPDEEGKMRPTSGGLRIGKPKLERSKEMPFSMNDEWDRDGQYFHYLTRWIDALLLVGEVTNDGKYYFWAADLCAVTMKSFIKETRIPWKMSVDLKRVQINSQGATDPLDGLITLRKVLSAVPEFKKELKPHASILRHLCRNKSWSSPDPLGTGRLLINAHDLKQLSLPSTQVLNWQELLAQACVGIDHLLNGKTFNKPVDSRLAFRECALSHGIRVWQKEGSYMEDYIPLAEEIESFWLNAISTDTWRDHEDINAVTLSASLLN